MDSLVASDGASPADAVIDASDPVAADRSKSSGAPRNIIAAGRPFAHGRRRRTPIPLLATIAASGLLVGSIFWVKRPPSPVPSTTARLPAATVAQPLNLPPPDLLKPLSPQQATAENAERPFVDRPDSPAAKFILYTDAQDRDRAVNCLTQAVYYEAASEGADGQRAVAQVVLNRLHHPGFPSTVCGVVYQGAERGIGCQFTFVCDGSLQRAPIPALWTRSQKIAEQALAGKVFGPVGHATHYHADYVLPYWADMLDKSVQIGRHIFYRLRGSLGDARGFSQRYGGAEPELPKRPQPNLVLPATPETAALTDTLKADTPPASPGVEKAAASVSPLAIDSAKSTLLADGSSVAVPNHPRKTRDTGDCVTRNDQTKLSPLKSNDERASEDASCD